MPKLKDITGNRYERVVAKRYIKDDGVHKYKWECECDCGGIVYATRYELEHGKVKSCGCYRKENIHEPKIDITGKRYGRLVAIKPEIIANKLKWEFHCDCGNTFYCSLSEINQGKTNSCGCLQKEIAHNNRYVDISGEKFGRLLVVEEFGRTKNGRTLWKCKCDCGKEICKTTTSLMQSKLPSCGCYKIERTKDCRKKTRKIYQ